MTFSGSLCVSGILSLGFVFGLLAACQSSVDDADVTVTETDAGGPADGGSSGLHSSSDAAVTDGPPDADRGIPAAVHGVVISGIHVVPGATVLLQGQTLTTGADGAFVAPGIYAPYDVSVVLPADLASPAPMPRPEVLTYVGLRVVSPILRTGARLPSVAAHATVALQNTTETSGNEWVVLPTRGDVTGSQRSRSEEPGAVAALDLGLPVESVDHDVTFFALEYTRPSATSAFHGIPTDYLWFGSVTEAVHAGDDIATTLVLAPVPSETVTGSIEFPVGYTQDERTLKLGLSLGASLTFSEPGVASGTAFSWSVPVAMGSTFSEYRVISRAHGPDGSASFGSARVEPNGAPVTLTLGSPPVPLLPEANASGVGAGSTISWEALDPECVYRVGLTSEVAGAPEYDFRTTATQMVLPALPGVATLPSQTPYRWSVTCIRTGSSGTIDQQVQLLAVDVDNGSTSAARPFLSL